jgi:hypothetical protein
MQLMLSSTSISFSWCWCWQLVAVACRGCPAKPVMLLTAGAACSGR